jgi:hypothetical protein
MTLILVLLTLMLFAVRLRTLQRVWRLPLRNGEEFFLAQRVGPDFYRSAGAPLLRRYHVSALVTLFLDVPLAAWSIVTERYAALAIEQFLVLVVSIAAYSFMVPHFSALATSLCVGQERPPTNSLQLSMTPRRLRDYTIPGVEVIVVVATLLALAMVARCYALSLAVNASRSDFAALRGGTLLTVWVLYWQVGLLLIKGAVIRRRMPLPANRTEDFRRWRMAWLNHKLRGYDAVRVFSALSLLLGMTWVTYGREWSHIEQTILFGVSALVILLYLVYVSREERRLAATEKELKPVEMVKEFPHVSVAEGRYLAGGLLYLNRDNPWVIVRSARGLALNLAHRTTHIAAVYLMGLVVLGISMARLMH